MTADGNYTAVLDRFEEANGEDRNELAVLLLESGEKVVAERAIPRWRLPEDARQQDAVLSLSLRNGFVVSIEYDPEATERRTADAQSRFDRLAKRPTEDGSAKRPGEDGPVKRSDENRPGDGSDNAGEGESGGVGEKGSDSAGKEESQ